MIGWVLALLRLVMVCLLFAPSLAFGKTDGQALVPGVKVEATVDSLNQLAFQEKRYNINQAFSLLHKAYKLAQLHQYDKGRATSYLYEAGIYQQNGHSKVALSLYTKSLELSLVAKDTFNIARARQQIASAFLEDRQLKKAEALYQQSLKDYMALRRYDDAVNVKNSLGLLQLKAKQFTAAEKYFTQALEESKRDQYAYGYKKAIFHLGLLYLKLGNLAKAKTYFTQSLKLDQKSDDRYGLSLSNKKLAVVANQEGKRDEAIKWAFLALKNARSIQATHLEIEAIETLVDVYKSLKQYAVQAQWQDSLIQKQAQLFEAEKSYAITFLDILKEKQEQQMAYEKEAQLASQKAKIFNYALGMVIVVVMALAVIAYLVYRNYLKAKSLSEELALKNEVMQKHGVALDLLNKAVTERNALLDEASQMKDKLLSILSHDMKAPLANTKGILQLINSGVLPPEQYQSLLKELEKQYGKSMTQLDNLLFWIKIQMKGKAVLSNEINLKTLLTEVIDEQDLAAQYKRVTITNDVAPGLRVVGDHEMLKVVFRNLLSNSVKFTRKDGKVAVSAALGKGVLVKIKDQGVGISEDVLKKIKSKSYYTTVGTENEAGSGFGLMICDELISRHGGELAIESKESEGSVFTVQLPAFAA